MGSTLLSFPIYWKWCCLCNTPRKTGLLLIYSDPSCNKFIQSLPSEIIPQVWKLRWETFFYYHYVEKRKSPRNDFRKHQVHCEVDPSPYSINSPTSAIPYSDRSDRSDTLSFLESRQLGSHVQQCLKGLITFFLFDRQLPCPKSQFLPEKERILAI